MSKTYRIFALLAVCGILALSSCLSRKSVSSSQECLLRVIPSDACAFVLCQHLGTGLETVSSYANPFEDLSFASLSSAPMVISYNWTGELTPMLAVYAGSGRNAEKNCSELLESAQNCGLETLLSEGEDGQCVLLVSPSASIIEASERHRENGSSVLDVNGVSDAVESFTSKTAVLVVRNDAISRLLPKDFLGAYFKKATLNSFLGSFCEWTVLNLEKTSPAGRGEYLDYSVRSVHDEDSAWGVNLLESCPPSVVKVSSLLPQGTVFLLDQSFEDCSQYIEARKRYLDSAGKLNSFNNSCSSLKRSCGKDPLDYLRETDIREVAKVRWKDEEVLLLRPAKQMVSHDVRYNRYRGYIPLLFGEGYRIADDSQCVCIGNWLVLGSAPAVRHFLASELRYKGRIPREASLVLLADDLLVSRTGSGLQLEYYRNY